MAMKRVILHWSAGGHKANATDKKHYHVIIEGDGKVVRGDHTISDNESTATPYAAHTRGLNTGSIGIAVAAMRGAKERPFSAGPSPITSVQVNALVDQTASLCRQHGIPVTRQTVLTHAEVERTLGVKQRNKWDIMWLPGMTSTGDAIEIGDKLRDRIQNALTPPTSPRAPITAPRPTERPTGLAAVLSWIFKFLSKGGPA